MKNIKHLCGSIKECPKNEDQYYLAFSHFLKIGPITLNKLITYFNNLENAFYADSRELRAAGLTNNLSEEFCCWRKNINLAKILFELEKQQISYSCLNNDSYPKILKNIADPPIVIYYKGKSIANLKNRLAVVGSRKPSAYAEKVVAFLLPPIIKYQIEIVSGLAIGTDTLAHKTCLESQGITLAILGSSLDTKNIYPSCNIKLAEQIIKQNGTIISEFPPNTPPLKQNFPRRNRLISGLSKATLIIEAQSRSGTLITANYALEQGRDVLVVPGNIFSANSNGTNNLIRSGAIPITNPNNILEVFNLDNEEKNKNNSKNSFKTNNTSKPKKTIKLNNETEILIYNIIKRSSEKAETINTDEIIKETKLDTAIITSTLTLLEISGLVKNTESGYDLN